MAGLVVYPSVACRACTRRRLVVPFSHGFQTRCHRYKLMAGGLRSSCSINLQAYVYTGESSLPFILFTYSISIYYPGNRSHVLRLHHLFSKYVFMSSAGSGWHDLWPAWPLSTSSSRSRCITDLQRSIVSSICRIQRRPLQHRRLALGTTPGCVPGYLDEISSAIARADGHVFTPPPFQPCLHPQAKCQFQLNIFTISI
jgi:hypothetical protein